MNPRTRRAALYAIGAIAILASANALTHSYAGLYDWATHHSLSGWQAMSWPAEIDVFLAIGELALYVAYLDGWPARQRIWPWATALIGLSVSVAGNIGHIQAMPGHPVILADRLTAATSPLAAFAGLAIGLLVLKMTRQQAKGNAQRSDIEMDQPGQLATSRLLSPMLTLPTVLPSEGTADIFSGDPREGMLRQAAVLCQNAASNGERLSQRTLARQLRGHGYRFSNEHLHAIAVSIGLAGQQAA